MLGAQIDGPQQATFNGLHLDFYPRVTWSPFFAMTTDDLKVCCSDILPVDYLISDKRACNCKQVQDLRGLAYSTLTLTVVVNFKMRQVKTRAKCTETNILL